jgi:putative sigma-54 modulation protein
MQVAIHGKNQLEVTAALRDFVQQRLDKLDRYFGDGGGPTAQVVLSVQRERQSVEVTIPLDGFLLRAEEAEPSMYAAVDLVLDKLDRQIRKFRTRAHRRPRHEGPRPDREPAAEAGPQPGEEAVVRTKRFALKPMTVDEAVLQMNLLGHDFFVFREASSLEVQVLYRRREGGYGLIAGQ